MNLQDAQSDSINAPELMRRMLTEADVREARPLRRAWKISDGRGLYLMVAPTGGRYWRYNYRFEGRQKTLALGTFPDISLDTARERHQRARSLLAEGVDPSRYRVVIKRTVGAPLDVR